MLAPIRLVRGGWPRRFEDWAKRFVWADPSVVIAEDASPADFRVAMSAFNVGNTIKITEANRHPDADALLLEHVELAGSSLVDIGASDGSTSVDLIRRLPAFKSYLISDLYLTLGYSTLFRQTLFFDPQGTCILVTGRRLIAWPSISAIVRWLYYPLIALAAHRSHQRRTVLLLNPEARQLITTDPRVRYVIHDVFDAWDEPHPDVIKVANLLRRLYFTEADLTRALRAIHASLNEGGHLLVVDNPRIVGAGPRAGLYQRRGERFALIARFGGEPEVDELAIGTVFAAT